MAIIYDQPHRITILIIDRSIRIIETKTKRKQKKKNWKFIQTKRSGREDCQKKKRWLFIDKEIDSIEEQQ